MSNTNTATVDNKPQSKMELASKLYDEIFTQGYDCGGKSQRAVFITRAIAELGMTKNGANTYFQNLSNKARGMDLYRYNKSKSTKASKPDVEGELPGTTSASEPTTGPQVAEAPDVVADLIQRWKVIGEGGEVVDSFPSRDKAKAAAAERGLKWKDGNSI